MFLDIKTIKFFSLSKLPKNIVKSKKSSPIVSVQPKSRPRNLNLLSIYLDSNIAVLPIFMNIFYYRKKNQNEEKYKRNDTDNL